MCVCVCVRACGSEKLPREMSKKPTGGAFRARKQSALTPAVTHSNLYRLYIFRTAHICLRAHTHTAECKTHMHAHPPTNKAQKHSICTDETIKHTRTKTSATWKLETWNPGLRGHTSALCSLISPGFLMYRHTQTHTTPAIPAPASPERKPPPASMHSASGSQEAIVLRSWKKWESITQFSETN